MIMTRNHSVSFWLTQCLIDFYTDPRAGILHACFWVHDGAFWVHLCLSRSAMVCHFCFRNCGTDSQMARNFEGAGRVTQVQADNFEFCTSATILFALHAMWASVPAQEKKKGQKNIHHLTMMAKYYAEDLASRFLRIPTVLWRCAAGKSGIALDGPHRRICTTKSATHYRYFPEALELCARTLENRKQIKNQGRTIFTRTLLVLY